MNPHDDRRRRRLDRLVAALNEDAIARLASLQPVTEDDPEESDELDEPEK